MSVGLFTRRGRYATSEKVERLRKHTVTALQTSAAERKLVLPEAFVQARTASEALAVLRAAVDATTFDSFVDGAFASLGPFGDEGHVAVYRVAADAAPAVRRPLFADEVGHDLNARSVAPAVMSPRHMPSRAILEETFRAAGQLALQLRFEDPDPRVVVENGVTRERIEYVPAPVDATYDPARRALFVHGGTRAHAIRVVQLVSGALQAQAGGAVLFEQPPALSEPILYAIVGALGAINPGGELRPFDPSMRRFRYGTTTDEDVRLNETGRRMKAEGLARDIEANVPHTVLVAKGPERTVRLRIDEHWGIRLRDPLEPEGYFSLFDRIQGWYIAGAWLRPLEALARQALERTNIAVSQTDISRLTGLVHDELLIVLGGHVPSNAPRPQKELISTLAANVLVRSMAIAAKLRGAKNVALGGGLVRFLDQHAALANVNLDEKRRAALVRHLWSLLDAADGDLLKFVRSAETVV